MDVWRFSPVERVRRSFRWKLLAALVASVALLATVTLLVVRRETGRQIEFVTQAAELRAQQAFVELEEQNRAQLSQLSTVFTGSVQAAAVLEAALEAGDVELLAQDVNYEFDARRIPHSLVAFTDAYGDHVLTMLHRSTLPGDDPAAVQPTAERILYDGDNEVFGYRAVEGSLYSVETLLLDLGRPIGTVTIGVPITDQDAVRLGSVIGAEVCFLYGGRCVVGTGRARALEPALLDLAGRTVSTRMDVDGERWRLLSDRVSADDDAVWRVIAVPLDPVVAPFGRVQRALAFGSLGALLLAVLLASALARNLTRPVRSLVHATSRIGAGDFDARVAVQSTDELGTLARAFNDMAAGLALKERYRGVLDKVVSPDVAAELLKGEVVLGGENREVTIVFGDITGFTTITDGMDPARVVSLLNECMELLSGAIEREGGVVDKYVGDEIMALFGAPVARGDDPLRAVRAALGMQRAMKQLNIERARRGEAPLGMSIGMNTGVVMAGNMGSANRLNYTVLGDAVNLAARVEHAASSGQVLLTAHTLRHVEPHVRVKSLGPRELRGFAQPVELFELLDVVAADTALDSGVRSSTPATEADGSSADGHAPAGRHGTGAGSAAATAPASASLALAALLAVLPPLATPALAQLVGELPTLEGVHFGSRGGGFQLGFSGRLDIEAYLPQDDPAWIIPSTTPFVAPRFRLFADAFFGDRIVGSAELRADGGEEPRAGALDARLDQLFLRLIAADVLALQAGKFVSPFGGWPQRHHTGADPFIRPPLTYDHRTVLSAVRSPVSAVDFLAWKDSPEQWRPGGAPAVWGAPYQWGAMLMGGSGLLDWRAAVVNSAPSSEPDEWGLARGFSAPSWVANAGAQLSPALRVELSHNRGPWLSQDAAGLPVDMRARDYDQRIWGIETVFKYGRTKLRGEAFHDSWGVPNVGYDVVDLSWYVEAEQSLATGFTIAARLGALHFLEMEGAVDTADPNYDASYAARWDYDVRRLQLAAGYRIARNAGVRGELMLNRTAGPIPPRANLLAAQFWWEF